jgi:GNAT superfamily N-acetyltransferase
MTEFYMSPLVPEDPANPEIMARIWNSAMPDEFSATPRFFAYNLKPVSGGIQGGSWMIDRGQPVGFVVASLLPNNERVQPAGLGWLDALVVEREHQGRGFGKLLVEWAHTYLQHMGCKRLRLGASMRAFVPGLPFDSRSLGFFQKVGYEELPNLCWDVARDLGDGLPIARHPLPENCEIRPCQVSDAAALFEFLWREFPGRWRFEIEDLFNIGGRPSDIMILKLGGRVEGFCLLTLPESARPLDRYYLHRYPQPWGQLGPIGVGHEVRGGGFGGLLLQAGLENLRAQGTRGCVIDWTNLLDFYGKYGFQPYHRYHMLTRSLE